MIIILCKYIMKNFDSRRVEFLIEHKINANKIVKIMNETSILDQTGGGLGDVSMVKDNENTNIMMSSTRQILDVSNKHIF